MSLIRPPSSGGYSVAAVGGTPTAGISGIHRKVEAKVVVLGGVNGYGELPPLGTDGRGTSIDSYFSGYIAAAITGFLLNFEVLVPSSRIRTAFGITAIKPDFAIGNSQPMVPNPDGYGCWNIVPGIKFPGVSGTKGTGDPDTSEVLSGQPIFPFTPADGGMGVFDPRDILSGGFDGTAANSGGTASSNGSAFPFAFTDKGPTTHWRVRAAVLSSASGASTRIVAPWYAWASWEIEDPRSGEDTAQLLQECQLVVPRAIQLA